MNTQFLIEAVALMGVCFAAYRFYLLNKKVTELAEEARGFKIFTLDMISEVRDEQSEMRKDIEDIIDDLDELN